MRYVVAFFLGVLLLLVVGIVFGFITLDFSAVDGPRLSLASVFSFCYIDDCESEDGGPTIIIEEVTFDPFDPYDPYYRETIYYGDSLDPYYSDSGDTIVEEWIEPDIRDYSPYVSGEHFVEEWIEYDSPSRTNRDPWYVSSFPGIGSMIQSIVPGQSGGASVYTPTPPTRPVYPQPSCWISANPTSVEYGKSSTLRWSSFNALRASLTDHGAVSLSGSRIVQNIRNDRSYQLSVSGNGGSGSCYARISIRAADGPSCFISAYPSTISSGQSTSLAWGSLNAYSAYLSGIGPVATQDGIYVAPQQTTTYTLTVFSSGGASNTCTAQVGVLP